jgi:Zn-dependent M16 (insulinase) family peptidase
MTPSNKKHTLKNEFICLILQVSKNAPFLQSLVEEGDFLFSLFLSMLAKFRKAVISFVMSVCRRGTTWLPINRFS